MSEEEDISYLDLGEDLGEIPDEKTVSPGEYEVRLASLELTKTKKDPSREMLAAAIEVVGEPLAKTIYHYLLIAKPNDDAKQALRRKRAIKRFYEAFKIPLVGKVKFEEYVGNTAWVVLGEESDKEYGMQNRISRFSQVG